MKTAILYESTHHGNTKKLCEAISKKYPVTLIDATKSIPDLSGFNIIGMASGVAYSKFYKTITEVAQKHLPAGKKVFFLYTCGKPSRDFSAHIRSIAEAKGCTSLGSYGCKGYDTYGPFKLMGGINKSNPTPEEVQGAVEFFEKIINQ